MLENCGDGVCDGLENCINCPDDCGCQDGAMCTTVGCVTDYCSHGLGQTGCCMQQTLISCDADGRMNVSNCAWSDMMCGWYSGGALDTGAYHCGKPPMLNTSGDPSGVYPLDCSEYCTPDCQGRECGDDGCGGSCGMCDSADPCRQDSTCVDGKCQAGQPVTCESDDPCQQAYCDSASGCLVRPKDDGFLCNEDGEPKARCRNGVCTELLPGDLCETALELIPGSELDIDLGKMFNDASPDMDCLDLGASGPDVFFRVEVERDVAYLFYLNGDGKLWLESDCDSSCLAASQKGSNYDQLLIFSPERSGTMILVLDTEEAQGTGHVTLGMQVASQESDGGHTTTDNEGCGCKHNPTGASWWWLVLIVLLSMRFVPTRRP